jgi:protein TonB
VSGAFWSTFEREAAPPQTAGAGAPCLLRWKHGDDERAHRVVCSIALAVVQHAVVAVWVAGLGALVEAPPPRLVVSLEALSPGPRGEGGASRGAGAPTSAALAPSPPAASNAPAATLAPPAKERAETPARPAPEQAREADRIPAPVPPKPVKERAVVKPKPAPAGPVPATPAAPDSVSKGSEVATGKTAAAPDAIGEGGAAGNAKGGGSGGSGAGAAGVESSYRARLLDRLARQKRYPARARAMGLEAQVMVRITIGRDGRVRSRTADPGTAAAIFAREAEAMVDRANPFPSVPDGLDGAAFEFRVPIEFRLSDAGG